jgi:hypothetical protein
VQIDRSDAKELRSNQPRCRKPRRYADDDSYNGDAHRLAEHHSRHIARTLLASSTLAATRWGRRARGYAKVLIVRDAVDVTCERDGQRTLPRQGIVDAGVQLGPDAKRHCRTNVGQDVPTRQLIGELLGERRTVLWCDRACRICLLRCERLG